MKNLLIVILLCCSFKESQHRYLVHYRWNHYKPISDKDFKYKSESGYLCDSVCIITSLNDSIKLTIKDHN